MNKQPATIDTAQAVALAAELRVVLGRLNRKLREQSHAGDLTGSQKTVLLNLEREGPATVSTLARHAGVRSQSMGATVAALQSAGLVGGEPDPADGRQTLWSLTPQCRKWLKAARAAREDWLLHAIQSKFSAREHDHIAAAAALLKRLAED